MSNVKLVNVNKVYDAGKGKTVQAVFDFSIDIEDKEFIVFVGPSGCGKSTTLRMIAGLEEITRGELYIDGVFSNYTHPRDRNIAMVFQSYALYPHLSVYDNLAFGLRIRKIHQPVYDKKGQPVYWIDKREIKGLKKDLEIYKSDYEELSKLDSENSSDLDAISKLIKETEERISYLENNEVHKTKLVHMSKEEIDQKVKNAAEILQITEYLQRKPRELSGGQRQRVALGRAIVRHPKVFLMDEPLSNLDAKLRMQMRSELVQLHKQVGATTIYVTHDQTEAMTMADRIVVMKDGFVQQIGTPKQIYHEPANLFVAGFTGSPSMNFADVIISGNGIKFNDFTSLKMSSKQASLVEDGEYVFGIRPEDIKLSDKGGIEVEISFLEMLGSELIIHFPVGASTFKLKVSTKNEYRIGDKVKVAFDKESIHIFHKEQGNRIF